MRLFAFIAISFCVLQAELADAQTIQLRNLEDALRIGEESSPRIRAADARRESAGGDRMQAEALPNPELFIDSDGFGGSKDYRGTRKIEVAAGVAQKIELGGKRQARIGIADVGIALATHEQRADHLNFREEIARAFVQALYAARLTALESDRLQNAIALSQAVRERVQNGREPAVQQRKSDITLASAELASQKAQREYQASLSQLGAILGAGPVEVVASTDWFDRIGTVPDIRSGDEALQDNPDFLRLKASIDQARAGIAKEESMAMPDVTMRAGMRRYNEDDSTAFLVGVSIPIPVFDTNRGGIARARQDLIRAEADAQALRLTLLGNLGKARHNILASHREVETMRAIIAPAADESLAAVREGYAAGKFGFLDLLDAQRTQFDVQAQLAIALRDYHLARIELMRLVGRTY